MVSWKRLTRWCRRRLIHLHNQNKHPHPLIWARGFAPPPKKTSLLTKSSLSSWFVQHSQPRAFVLPWLSWKILLVYFFQFGHFGGSVPCVLKRGFGWVCQKFYSASAANKQIRLSHTSPSVKSWHSGMFGDWKNHLVDHLGRSHKYGMNCMYDP